MLCNYQANANTTDDAFRTPSFYVIDAKNNKKEENKEIIQSLLSDGKADIDWQDKRKQTPLIHAIRRKLPSTVSRLLDFKPCLDKRNNKQRKKIRRNRLAQLLLQQPDRKTGKALLEDENARDRLLRQAVKTDLQEIILLLVAHGADPNTTNEHHETLLHQAAQKGDRNMVQRLLVYEKTSVNARDVHCRTALHIAAVYGHKSITGLLLTRNDVDINALEVNGATALCLAVQRGNTAIALQILAEDNVKINVAGRDGWTALHSATVMGNIPIIAVLLAKDDLDPNMLDEEKWAPLTYAASRGDLRMVELFLGRADIEVNVQGAPPLFHAAIEGHLDVLRRLLCFDTININQTYRDESPLCAASAMGHLEVTKLLLRHTTPPNINFKTYMGRTALSLAASGGHSHIVALLLQEKGLNVSAAHTFKETALCHSSLQGPSGTKW
ncbi:unnamed protein product [Penicillium manginii]